MQQTPPFLHTHTHKHTLTHMLHIPAQPHTGACQQSLLWVDKLMVISHSVLELKSVYFTQTLGLLIISDPTIKEGVATLEGIVTNFEICKKYVHRVHGKDFEQSFLQNNISPPC